MIFICGVSMLIPGQGFRDLYNNFNDRTNSVFIGSFFFNLAY